MRIDAYTHFFPKKFFDKMQEVAGDYKDMGKRVRSLPALFDLEHRKKLVDGFKDYRQILSYPQPPVETFAKTPAQIDELIRLINDGFAELCGLREYKPFECVGEIAESAAVMSYLGNHPGWREDAVVRRLTEDFPSLRAKDPAEYRALFEIRHPHRVPQSYMAMLDASG